MYTECSQLLMNSHTGSNIMPYVAPTTYCCEADSDHFLHGRLPSNNIAIYACSSIDYKQARRGSLQDRPDPEPSAETGGPFTRKLVASEECCRAI